MVKIATIFNELKQDFTQIRAEVEKRKSELSAIAKESDRFLAQYGEETNEMVILLNKTRDEQVIDNNLNKIKLFLFFLLFLTQCNTYTPGTRAGSKMVHILMYFCVLCLLNSADVL